ncbi:MAG: hypothetical protein ACRDCT_29080 [Shewanella sp.]
MWHSDFKPFSRHVSRTRHRLPTTHESNNIAHFMRQLARLSERAQWILYTAQCQRPNTQSLSTHHIDCGKVIHLKASKSHSEAEIVAQAIACRTASAIVASSAIDQETQQQLQHFAQQNDCALFFIKQAPLALH